MQRHCENAELIANYLDKHPKIEKVYWPGFNSHPNHNVSKQQMKGFGAMILSHQKATVMNLQLK